MFETLASGYGLAEGPCLDAMRRLCFCDVMAGGVYRIADDGGVQTMIPERTGVGGLVLHQDGGLVVSGSDVVHTRDGATRVVLQPPHGVVGFNDMAALPDGSLLAGALRYNPRSGDPPLPGEVLRIDATGAVATLPTTS